MEIRENVIELIAGIKTFMPIVIESACSKFSRVSEHHVVKMSDVEFTYQWRTESFYRIVHQLSNLSIHHIKIAHIQPPIIPTFLQLSYKKTFNEPMLNRHSYTKIGYKIPYATT